MLALLGFLIIGVFLFLIMTNRLSVLIALVLVPTVFALIGGFGLEMGDMMLEGIIKVAPTGIMIVFAVLYFGLMIDTGLFKPMISKMLRLVKGDPLKVVVGTAIVTMLVSLDGDGASTFMITITALLPLYKRLKMNPLILSGVVALGAGVMNLAPWGGPTARAMTTFNADSSQLFNPVIPAMIAGIVWVLASAFWLGKKERQRLGVIELEEHVQGFTEHAAALEAKGPRLFWFNLALTILLLIALIKVWLPLPILFIVAFAIALLVNYPNPEEQQKRLLSHANNVLIVSTMIFAAGIFTGILTGTKMIDGMASAMVSIIPESLASYLPVLVAVTSMPLSLVFTPDAYYFGVLPIISQTASNFGIDPIEIGRAAILGQMTTGFPLSPLTASTFILVGLAGVNLGDHQRFIFKWAFGTTIVMTIVALITGAITI
ncbi:TRAP transporter large permease subunit [Priestia megaterium]|jgi:citrate-Mg2+:H+ or citrate-Ca2+:H+ symporter, CitMHS family|uniref:Citrate transporter n=1 Tax=Priestia megaterium (strain ATCC 14581 / DSM 32 / CCUG 1817 / JCM 2506 / NBRC 15308 / NCIMB 9376 / NCTC 10342 / NRRL B-14308 / VKM B-512 / Ford 19) TaxID=1348623 RepID=A0A0B6AWY9_PRIM2|nr:citrate:proton symporter [Priestia megaterium]AJI25218.1 citrate transporter [Priestia megaterium NBRC 15308 = ATCC 14581]KFM96992.1 citrate transporter [Priestia megaterium]KGJ82424.1 citrate transporter [Priestia megaterium NBRC 15308 = ATCC 14581]MDR4230969.1 TRAP transporter large permease subunit [Priestia megaterium]MED3808120.1 citrate:proton symporter [Priestia megaterium]